MRHLWWHMRWDHHMLHLLTFVMALHTKCLQQDGSLEELWYAVGDGHILLIKKKELF